MSSSPVELLEGWRLNHTKGLSLFATSPVAATSAVAEESVVSVIVSEAAGAVVAALSLEPHPTADIAKTAAMVNTTSFFFMFITPFLLLIFTVYGIFACFL